ncbi:NmrA-like family domain-containing protein 1 [Lachnellula arida]|uniref:NmrA-like family domain-containing protein 1 n=1 Tax=Lachnellula arida TaxID=1316785 RepID=A0A8T9B5W0_9HELO|nr:NmrA-like family domain-containing protein 1 [Lachnellula arida]
MSKLIVIIGITGIQGGSIASHFSTLPDWTIRGITRMPTTPTASPLITANLNDLSSLISAFTGAHTIFSTTDFYSPFHDPHTQALLTEGQSINEYCYEQELAQGKNVADAAARTEGLQRLVVSSLCDASEWSAGRYTGVFHFDAKARAVRYVRDVYPELAAKMSVVQVGSYLSNWRGNLGVWKGQGEAVYLSVIQGTGTQQRPQTNVPKDLGRIVHAALQVVPGKNILGASFSISWTEQFKSWCEMNGLKYGGLHEITLEQFEKFIPIPGLGREIGEMMLFERDFGYDGGDPSVVLPGDLGVDCPLTSWEEYVKSEDWSEVLGKLK